MRIDLHGQSRYSRDSLTPLQALLRTHGSPGLGMVANTDHNFLHSLAKGQIRGCLSSPLIHAYPTYAKWRKGQVTR